MDVLKKKPIQEFQILKKNKNLEFQNKYKITRDEIHVLEVIENQKKIAKKLKFNSRCEILIES